MPECRRVSSLSTAKLLLLPLLVANIEPLHGSAHAPERFVRSERFYETANHVAFDCLRQRPLVRTGGHENCDFFLILSFFVLIAS